MQRLAGVLVLVTCIAMLGVQCTGGARQKWDPSVVQPDPIETYEIAPGDVLQIDGGKNPQITKTGARVDQQGFISLIYLGKVKAAGKTKSQLEQEIDAAYKESGQFTDSQVSVMVITLYYYVDGHVLNRGQKNYVRQITLYQAIIEAGGFTEYANAAKVRVLRPQKGDDPLVYVINCKRIMKGIDPDNFVVRPDDSIIVPRGY